MQITIQSSKNSGCLLAKAASKFNMNYTKYMDVTALLTRSSLLLETHPNLCLDNFC